MSQAATKEAIHFQHLPVIAKGAGLGIFGTFSGKLLLLLFNLLIARVLGPEQIGLYYLGYTLLNTIIIFVLLGLDQAIVRYVSLYYGEKNEEKVRGTILSSLIIIIPFSMIISVVMFLSADKIADYVFRKEALGNVIRYFSLTIPFLALTTLFLSITQALKKMQYKVLVKDIGDVILKLVLTSLFLLIGFKLLGAILATIASAIFMTILSFYYANKHVNLFTSTSLSSLNFGSLLRFSAPQALAGLINTGIINVNIIIIGRLLSAKLVGIFTIVIAISLVVELVINSFRMIFAPIISDLYNQKKMSILSELLKTVTKWIFGFSFPLFLITVFLSKHILSVFGPEFIAGSVALIIVSTGQFINTTTGPVGVMIIMSGRPTLALFVNLAAFVLSIILTFVFVPKYGLAGAAAAIAVSMATHNIIRLGVIKLTMQMHPFKLSYLKLIIAGIVSAFLVLILMQQLITGLSLTSLILLTLVFLLVYIFILSIVGIDTEDKMIVKMLREKFGFSRPAEHQG